MNSLFFQVLAQRMKLFVYVPKSFVCNVSIDLGAGDTSVAEKLLDGP
jgi:hypothetical protein